MEAAPERFGRGPERLEAFSDSVFAIAITLLVLDIRLPDLTEMSTADQIGRALVALWPSYVGYFVSFITIGNAWINHHNLFRFLGSVSHGVLISNLLLLLAIGFIPFPTALLARTLGGPGEQIGVVVYAATFFANALAFNLLWVQVKRVLKPGSPPAAIAAINRSYRLGPPVSLGALVISFAFPVAGLAIITGLMILYLLPRSTGA